MERIETVLGRLPERHRTALRWFVERAGQEYPWPQAVDAGNERTLLASKAKGIYKPEWSEYALSVRQTLGGPYPDRDPMMRIDGTWSYAYFQENEDPAARDEEFTNRGLVACWWDRVPVGVMRKSLADHVYGIEFSASLSSPAGMQATFSSMGSHPLGFAEVRAPQRNWMYSLTVGKPSTTPRASSIRTTSQTLGSVWSRRSFDVAGRVPSGRHF